VRLEVSSVRYYPGGRWLAVDPRVVELAVSAERGVTTTIAGVSAPEYRVLAKPLAVTAVTLKAKTTSDAIVGAPGALTAASISPTP
jgi:hypothetical protein